MINFWVKILSAKKISFGRNPYFAVTFVLLCGVSNMAKAQKDTIAISINLDEVNYVMHVKQMILYKNALNRPVDSIKLFAWANAYKNTHTLLGKRKLEERKTDLYFANKEQLGYIKNLKINSDFVKEISDTRKENIYLKLRNALPADSRIPINLEYDIHLPAATITNYGYSGNHVLLKYFFVVPDGFEDNKLSPKYFIDIDDNQSAGNYWKITFENPDYFVHSNLKEINKYHLEGLLYEDPEILITHSQNTEIPLEVDQQKVQLDLGYEVSDEDKARLQTIVPKQLLFIKNKMGFLPEKIFLGERERNKDGFMGSDDISFKKWRFKIFTDDERTDLNYFSMISKNVVEQSFMTDKDKNHWLYNGLRTYLEMEYIKQNYADRKLLGDLPDEVKLWKIKPLKWFGASKLKLSERYGLVYQYILNQNLDQKLSTPLHNLSKFNVMAISSFEMGSIFSLLSEKTGQEKFDTFLTDYFAKNRGQQIDSKDFLDQMTVATNYSGSFVEKFMQKKNRINLKLKSTKQTDPENINLKISKNTNLKVPFKLQTESYSGKIDTYYYDTTESKKAALYTIPRDSTKKILLNDDYAFPEDDFRDNYRYTKGLFANMKKVRFKLATDIPNPEYNEVYFSPNVTWNNYDKFLIGGRFTNRSLMPPKFLYSLSPFYSTGTNQITGSGGLSYRWQPAHAFFSTWNFGGGASYFHYDYNLPYKTYNLYSNLTFAKNPRSQINRSLLFSYSYFEKTLSPELIKENAYGKYNLWNVGYSYSDNKAIHENYFTTNFQWMEDFQKLSAEYYYRWEFAKRKKLMVRVFAGIFVNNVTRNNTFNFGISKVSNYAFNYGLLGQSAQEGLLAQQFILAEGGFKSNFNTWANRWIVSTNIDSHLWKMFNVYADVGMYKDRDVGAKFIWDSGIKLKVIPDFLEIYFPVQSSLGFEPGFKGYGSRIRYTLNLNLGSVISYFRRGVY